MNALAFFLDLPCDSHWHRTCDPPKLSKPPWFECCFAHHLLRRLPSVMRIHLRVWEKKSVASKNVTNRRLQSIWLTLLAAHLTNTNMYDAKAPSSDKNADKIIIVIIGMAMKTEWESRTIRENTRMWMWILKSILWQSRIVVSNHSISGSLCVMSYRRFFTTAYVLTYTSMPQTTHTNNKPHSEC